MCTRSGIEWRMTSTRLLAAEASLSLRHPDSIHAGMLNHGAVEPEIIMVTFSRWICYLSLLSCLCAVVLSAVPLHIGIDCGLQPIRVHIQRCTLLDTRLSVQFLTL